MITPGEQKLIGEAPEFRRLLKTAHLVAPTDANVLLLGESGTGKKLIARTIHGDSPRRDRPFVAVSCAGGSEAPIAFDPFDQAEQIAGGTLYIDEVVELSLADQAQLLRFLQDAPLSGQPGPRVLAASTRDLWSAVESGEFRRDLYYRLYVVPVEIPSLRDRLEDIPLLLEHFIVVAAANHDLDRVRFTATADRLLRRYPWPGNVRELCNLCERMVILFSGCEIAPENLPWEIRRGESAATDGLAFKLPAGGINLQDLEVEVIRQALTLAAGNKSRAARLLGLTRDTLLYRLRKYLISA
jgi:DNA-binding NtrC family response regulator